MDTNSLKLFEEKERPFEKAIVGFWEYTNSWKEEEPFEFQQAFKTMDTSEISLIKEKIAYVINYRFDEPIEYIQTTLNVFLDERLIARYHYLQHLNGEIMDDSLSFV
ncbi:hypothetical protein [Paenibacillus sp.]|uniref:hypothetical protein n=1 Tax=Paenibacillus sp. TaxID=58172 RepID=UPI00282A6371|nr:hypothetical protein [Paenibacillus sp.]MDR0269746.1 hypothetical protein [Paenibacillus sp.]